jgi:hypothetical protein
LRASASPRLARALIAAKSGWAARVEPRARNAAVRRARGVREWRGRDAALLGTACG